MFDRPRLVSARLLATQLFGLLVGCHFDAPEVDQQGAPIDAESYGAGGVPAPMIPSDTEPDPDTNDSASGGAAPDNGMSTNVGSGGTSTEPTITPPCASSEACETPHEGGKDPVEPLEPLPTEPEDSAMPCPNDAHLVRLSPPGYYSWPGTVFGSVQPTGNGENHAPKPLDVRVETESGLPVEGCEVRFVAGPEEGWAFSAQPTTDAQGELYGYWTAGSPGQNSVDAVIKREDGTESRVTFEGTVLDHQSRTNSVHVNYPVDGAYTEVKIRITPMEAGPATYFSALNWKDSYAGIQFDENANEGVRTLVLFSVWDAGGQKAAIDDAGLCNKTVGFGGEGTGTSCRLIFPPQNHGSIAGLPDDYMLELGHTYELHLTTGPSGGRTANTLTFTDVTRGIGPLSLGTQSTGTPFAGGGYVSSFVEEWYPHGSCLSATRAVYYHGLQYRVGAAEWQQVNQATFSPGYLSTNNEVCGNYLAQAEGDKWFISSGGSKYVGRPFVPNDPYFPKYQSPMVLD